MLNELLERLAPYMQSADLEVQERASCAVHILKLVAKHQEAGAEIINELMQLFHGELNPVAPKAQKKVPIPEGYVHIEHGRVMFPFQIISHRNPHLLPDWIWTHGSTSRNPTLKMKSRMLAKDR